MKAEGTKQGRKGTNWSGQEAEGEQWTTALSKMVTLKNTLTYIELTNVGWREGSVVRSVHCSCRGPKFFWVQ